MLTSVPLTLVDETDSLPTALVAGLLPDGSLEESLAALAADGSVVTTRGSVPTHHTQLGGLLVQGQEVGRGEGRCELPPQLLHLCQWGSD